MNQTPNYQLNQWEAEDKVQRTDFNADNAKIDVALTALSAADAAETQARKALAADVLKRGNCQIYYSTYTGNGELSRTHTFPRKPLFVAIGMTTDIHYIEMIWGMGPVGCCYDGKYSGRCSAKWSGNSVTVWGAIDQISYMCNIKNASYVMIALFAMDE